MSKFEFDKIGKIIVLNLKPGDLLLECIQTELKSSNVRNAVLVSALGSLCKLNYHVIGAITPQPDDIFRSVEAPVELGVMQGMVLDGVPHIHLVASTPDGKTHIGHLEPGCVVQYLIEMTFLEIEDMDLRRVPNQYGIGYFEEIK